MGFFGTLFLPIDIAEAYANTYINITNVTDTVLINDSTGEVIPAASPAGQGRRILRQWAGENLRDLASSAASTVFPGLTQAAAALSEALSDSSSSSSRSELNVKNHGSTSSRKEKKKEGTAALSRWLQDGPVDPSGGGGDGGGGLDPSGLPSNDTNNGTSSEVVWELEEETYQVRNGPMENMWTFVYWFTFILTYVIIPVVQEYVVAGDFSKCGRFKTSMRLNLLFYIIIAVVVAGALAYVIFGAGMTFSDLFPILTVIANTYGLVFVVLLLGYGTAELPRTLWSWSDSRGELDRLYFTASEIEAEYFDSKTEIAEIQAAIRKMEQQINLMAQQPDYSSGEGLADMEELQRCLAVVLGKCIYNDPTSRAGRSFNFLVRAEETEEDKKKLAKGWKKSKVVLGKLADLHKALMAARLKIEKKKFRWERHVLRALELEYVTAGEVPPTVMTARGRSATGSYFSGPEENELPVPNSGTAGDLAGNGVSALSGLTKCPNLCGGAVNRWFWHWKLHFSRATFRTLAVLAEIFSLLLIWSEATIWVNLSGITSTNLSVFGAILRAADLGGDNGYLAIQIASFIPLAYMCICSTYTMFKLKLFDLLDLSPHQHTDPYSLCINATYFNRIQFSLGFNFLNVLMHSNKKADYPDTAFMHSVGVKMKLSVVDWYLPIAILVIYILCKVNLFERAMRLLGIDEKGSPIRGNAKHEEIIADGKKLIVRAKRDMGLLTEEEYAAAAGGAAGAAARVSNWASSFGDKLKAGFATGGSGSPAAAGPAGAGGGAGGAAGVGMGGGAAGRQYELAPPSAGSLAGAGGARPGSSLSNFLSGAGPAGGRAGAGAGASAAAPPPPSSSFPSSSSFSFGGSSGSGAGAGAVGRQPAAAAAPASSGFSSSSFPSFPSSSSSGGFGAGSSRPAAGAAGGGLSGGAGSVSGGLGGNSLASKMKGKKTTAYGV